MEAAGAWFTASKPVNRGQCSRLHVAVANGARAFGFEDHSGVSAAAVAPPLCYSGVRGIFAVVARACTNRGLATFLDVAKI